MRMIASGSQDHPASGIQRVPGGVWVIVMGYLLLGQLA